MRTRLQQQCAQQVRKTIAKAIHAFSQGFFEESWRLLSLLATLCRHLYKVAIH